ncbi:MAG: hypothetical protein HY755_07385 [Nitrospirae bacterium]|nr:hypothetical protein [Nitrospirota bacterium]
MDFSTKLALVAGIFVLTFIINIPLGYLRKRTRKYSFRWFLYIHLPIPLIILIRILSHIEFKYVPLFIFAAVIGQICGGKLEFKP